MPPQPPPVIPSINISSNASIQSRDDERGGEGRGYDHHSNRERQFSESTNNTQSDSNTLVNPSGSYIRGTPGASHGPHNSGGGQGEVPVREGEGDVREALDSRYARALMDDVEFELTEDRADDLRDELSRPVASQRPHFHHPQQNNKFEDESGHLTAGDSSKPDGRDHIEGEVGEGGGGGEHHHHHNSGGESTATNSSDEFDWEADSQPEDEDELTSAAVKGSGGKDDGGAGKDEEKVGPGGPGSGSRKRVQRAKRLRKVYLGCMRLSRPVRTLLIAVIGCGILITPSLVVWLRFNSSTSQVHDNVLMWSVWFTISFAAACATSILVDFLPALVFQVSLVLFGVAPEWLKTNMELVMATKFWSKLCLDMAWMWIIVSVMSGLFFHDARQNTLKYFDKVIQAIACLFGTSLVLFVEKFLLRMIAINFHKTAVQDRLEENSKALWALDKLAAAKERRTDRSRQGGGHGHHHWPHMSHSGISAALHSAFGSRNPSPTHSRPGTPGATSRSNTGAVGQVAPGAVGGKSKNSGNNSAFNSPPNGGGGNTPVRGAGQNQVQGHQHHQSHSHGRSKSEVKGFAASTQGSRDSPAPVTGRDNKRRSGIRAKNIAEQLSDALAAATLKDSSKRRYGMGSTYSARRLARKLFEGLQDQGRNHLLLEDFVPYFGNETDARTAFMLFDKDGNGDISKREMREAVQRIYRERKALAVSLKDMSSAVAKLDAVLLFIGLIIVIFIWLLVFDGASTLTNLVPFATIILGLSFIFGNSAKNVFESMIYTFATHPYDVGDLVFIDDQPLMVKEFGMISTVFCRVDGQIITAPNSILATEKFIMNVRRSGSMWETTNIMVAFDTPIETLDDLRTKLRAWISENPRKWAGGLNLNVDNVSNQNCITLIVAMEHKGNWQDWGARWDRRNEFMKAMKTILDELQITYHLVPQPISFQPKSGQPPFKPGMPNSPRSPRFNQDTGLSPPSFNAARQAFAPDSTALGNAGHYQPNLPSAAVGDRSTLRIDTSQSFRSGAR